MTEQCVRVAVWMWSVWLCGQTLINTERFSDCRRVESAGGSERETSEVREGQEQRGKVWERLFPGDPGNGLREVWRRKERQWEPERKIGFYLVECFGKFGVICWKLLLRSCDLLLGRLAIEDGELNKHQLQITIQLFVAFSFVMLSNNWTFCMLLELKGT